MARRPLVPSVVFAALVTFFAFGWIDVRPARAGGYDTPILYSARHQGMGGTAIGYVDDPSSVFHNPAGLSQMRGLHFLGDLSLLTGAITSSPGNPDLARADGTYPSRTSNTAVSPLFMLAAGYRVAEPVAVGLAFYPVAAAAAEYHARNLIDRPTIDKTRLVFAEVSPAISIQVFRQLSLGIGYRLTIVTLERVKGDADRPREFDFSMSGLDWKGVRAGVQWRPSDDFGIGLVYRHRVEPTLRADKGYAYTDLIDAQTSLILPSKLGLGVSGRWDRLRPALDVEYGFNSQNGRTILRGFNPALNKTEQVVNYFEWQNSITARVGVEYALGEFAARAGYIFDGKVSNKAYPSAFGTPPAPSHSVTVGGGFRGATWQTNLALVYRFTSTDVTPADVAGAEACASCAKPGQDYSLKMLGVFLDFSKQFDVTPAFGASP